MSPSNSTGEMNEEIELHLAKEAKEVWNVAEDGGIEDFTYEGRIERSEEISGQ